MFCKKGFCRYLGKKCQHLRMKNQKCWCKKTYWYRYIDDEKTGKPKIISENKYVNIEAPKWCPKK